MVKPFIIYAFLKDDADAEWYILVLLLLINHFNVFSLGRNLDLFTMADEKINLLKETNKFL